MLARRGGPQWLAARWGSTDSWFPTSTRRIFKPNPDRARRKGPEAGARRVNALGTQVLPAQLHRPLFGANAEGPGHPDPTVFEACKAALHRHGMQTKPSDYVDDVALRGLPPLLGPNVVEHFANIGEKQAQPYRDLVQGFLQKGIPGRPDAWAMQEGWTRYVPGREPERVECPLEPTVVLDVEVCMAVGMAPTLATAVSDEAWYGWVSRDLVKGEAAPVANHQYRLDSLIPFEKRCGNDGPERRKPKVVIGHNVAYDRARIREQYLPERSGTRFVDTMSLHISVSGLSSYQRAMLKSHNAAPDSEPEDWMELGSSNGLDEVYKLYCKKQLSKDTRQIFVKGGLGDIKGDFQRAMEYCAGDAAATFEVLRELFPLFLERFPHPVTFAGILELGTAYLPINANWNRYIRSAEAAYEGMKDERTSLLKVRAEEALKLGEGDRYKEDLWMWDEDWSVVKKSKFMPGVPRWYRNLCSKPGDNPAPDWKPEPDLITTAMRVTPKLLRLTWEGYPLHFITKKGWGFLVPFTDEAPSDAKVPLQKLLEKCPLPPSLPNAEDDKQFDSLRNISKDVDQELARKQFYAKLKADKTGGVYKGTGVWCNSVVDDCCYFFRLPHKNGPSYNVGNPLGKDFLDKFSQNVLFSDTPGVQRVMALTNMMAYWTNNRDRIVNQQMVVWLDADGGGESTGAIVPQVVVCGTVTRRAVEKTWMTASNAHKERVGSELRAMIQAPKGYNIIGADVDSQELWIASVIGDAHHAGMHGATPLGWMTLNGSKSDGTDMHSVTAKAIGVSRDQAKVINYARIYGAGQSFAEKLLKQFNPAISEAEARAKARKMFDLTKGKRVCLMKEPRPEDFEDRPYTTWEAMKIAKVHNKRFYEMFHKSKWVGGTESAMFNRLEEIANSAEPCTPFLDCRLSRALESDGENDSRYLPTLINWVVQSGAVDFLHLMLVCMRWLMGDRARFCISFHDEIRYVVPEGYRYRAALAMHVTNLLTRAFCSARLGVHDLPLSVAFFSSVEVDSAWRKESRHTCETPSNPRGLLEGYGVPDGESLDVKEAVRRAEEEAGSKKWYEFEKDA